jgi:hypothetical protein
MPKCFIKSELELSNGLSQYRVLFEADDGYQEEQVYQCTEVALKDALTHFNDEHLSSMKASLEFVNQDEEPRVLTVKSSKQAVDNLKAVQAAGLATEEEV